MKPRILFLAPSYACAPVTGGGQRTMLLYNALADAYAVDALVVDEWGAQGADKLFAHGGFDYLRVTRPGKRGVVGLLPGVNPAAADKLAMVLYGRKVSYRRDAKAAVDFGAYDLIVSRYLRPAAQAGALEDGVETPTLIDIDDRDDQVLDARLAESRNPATRAMLKRHRDEMRILFRELTERAAHLWVVTETDRTAISHRSVSLLPNIPFHIPADAPPRPRSSHTLLFVGAGGHRPNIEGVFRFVDKAWPAILAAAPNARLRIVGSGPWARHAEKLSAPGVSLIGAVDDLAAEYADAAIAVCPVFEGGGSKIKVLEALAHNCPVVSTIHSARGFVSDLTERALVTAPDEAGMATACIALLRDPAAAAARAAAGREIVLANYSRGGFAAAVLAACRRVLDESRGSENR